MNAGLWEYAVFVNCMIINTCRVFAALMKKISDKIPTDLCICILLKENISTSLFSGSLNPNSNLKIKICKRNKNARNQVPVSELILCIHELQK